MKRYRALPKWLDDDRYDIVAKMVSDDATPKGPQVLDQQLQQMLKALLEDEGPLGGPARERL